MSIRSVSVLSIVAAIAILSVSPVRAQGDPDPDGAQLKMICQELEKRPECKYVWYDYCCLPQSDKVRKRTVDEQVCFQWGLDHVNVLYLLFPVIILLDNNYISRFWCLMESWLSMQKVTNGILSPAEESRQRYTILCMHNANPFLVKAIENGLANCSALDAYKTLRKEDISVTNKSDKQKQVKACTLSHHRSHITTPFPHTHHPLAPSHSCRRF